MLSESQEDCFSNAAEGAIVKIELEKFVNFRSIAFYPSPRLNIVTAPNGSGKSTLISAIVLALGGSPTVIGRSSHEGDYIMSGENHAIIHIELNNPHGRNHLIRRDIKKSKSGATSEWYICHKKVSGNQVQEFVKKLNIQVNNLCQVLSQDRVQDFAIMNHLELFANTQKTIGDTNLYKKYNHLKELRVSQSQKKSEMESFTKRHQSLVEVIQGMEKDVQVIVEHKRVLKSLETCTRKLSWAVYNEKKLEFDKITKNLNEKENELKQIESQSEPLKKKLRRLDQRALESKKDVVSKVKQTCKVQEALSEGRARVKNVVDRIAVMKANAKEEGRNRERALEEASVIETQISSHRQKLRDFDEEQLTEQIKYVERDLEELIKIGSELRLTKSQLSDTRVNAHNNMRAVERSLTHANSSDQKQLSILQNFPGALAAYNWVRNNRQKISSPVHAPLFMELSVPDLSKAKYVECVIPQREKVVFIVESSQGTTELLTIRSELNLNFNVACSEPPENNISIAFPPRIPLSQMKLYGFDCYLIDLVQGHPAVLAYLCKILNFHNIPVAFKPINTNNVPPAIKYYLSDDVIYRVSVSKYSKQRSVASQNIPAPKFLSIASDEGLILELNKQLNIRKRKVESVEEELTRLVNAERDNETAMNELKNKKRQLMANREQVRGILVRVKRLEDDHKRCVETANIPTADQSVLHESIKNAVTVLVKEQGSLLDELRQFTEADTALKLAEIYMDAVSRECLSLRERIETDTESTATLKRDVDELRRLENAAKLEARETEGIAKRSTNSLCPSDPEFKKRYANAFARMPSTVNELRDKLHTLKARASCLHNSQHEELLEKYEQRKEEAKELEGALEKLKNDTISLESYMQELRTEWRTQIDLLISQLNASFSQFFSAMGCCGEIRLATGDNEEHIENYGLEMLVKFRDTQPLAVVDGFTQSGGEKALSTAVFLLSLQRLSISPFHCMDEINQGMDEFNERRVYNLLFHTISDVPSQFFLITPKLLTDLDYPDHVTVHTVYNSAAVKS